MQEPLLYRCSLSCRIIRQFESVYSHQPINSRYDIYCPQLHFSLSDTQLPMFLRLLELLLALYYKQLQYQPPNSKSDENSINEEGNDVAITEGKALHNFLQAHLRIISDVDARHINAKLMNVNNLIITLTDKSFLYLKHFS